VDLNPALYFASYRLDPRAQVLWQGDEPVRLTPKAFGVLDYLARHADRVVTKHELLDHVWPEVHVGDAVLKVAIREIRHALDDDSDAPRFVQTARRVGYRFVAPVSSAEPSAQTAAGGEREVAAPAPAEAAADLTLVGRDRALQTLTASLARAMSGTRQVVFVIGEGGIGKTSVVDSFLARVERQRTAWIARGQCMEHAGGAEAYLPVLDALGRLARAPEREPLMALLRRYAPTWLAQMPALVDEREALKHEIFGATPERMLREIAEALEALTATTPLVLFLDDLHWSDDATLDFVGLMARRSGASRLLLVAAYRPVDVALSRPALKLMKQELAAKGLCEAIALDFLTPDDAAAFLDVRFPGHAFPPGLAALIHQRTNGNPLFMGNLMDYLAAQGMVARRAERWELTAPLETVATASPETLRQVIEAQLARLSSEEHAALEAASVCGIDFSAVAVAAGLGSTEEAAEACLDGLAHRGQFVESLELIELPQRGWSPRYQFVHSLLQETLYRLLPPARRLRLHMRIAERIEQLYGEDSGQVASELAEHFEQARDYPRAIKYLRLAAVNETRRFANREAAGWLQHALELASQLPAADQPGARAHILTDLGRVRRSMGDMRGSSEAFLEAGRTSREHGNVQATVEALLLAGSALTWFDRTACLSTADEAEQLASQISPTLVLYTRGYAAYWHLIWGPWHEADARDCERALELARESQDRLRLFSMLPRCSYVRLAQGQYAAAALAAAEGSLLALASDDAFGRMVCQFYRMWGELLAGQLGQTDALLSESLQLAERNGHRSWEILFAALRAWFLRETGAHEQAAALAAQAVDASRTLRVPFGELVSQTELGLALVDTGDAAAGIEVLQPLVDRLDREPTLMGIAWRMPVHVGLSTAHRLRRAWPEAEANARRACDLAATSGEPTWLALGWTACAEAALAQRHHDRAIEAIDRAVGTLTNADAPLAAWRVHACAARVAAAQGLTERAVDHQARADSVINRLADSMPIASEARRTFLTSVRNLKSEV
jgi:DNA-binding winged helix-turn-helix (wHTH) protein/tetratricopeptide (TPR) repeat protein